MELMGGEGQQVHLHRLHIDAGGLRLDRVRVKQDPRLAADGADLGNGWMVPISLLANMTLTRQVSGRMASRTCSAVTTPSGGMSSRVTSKPSRSRAWRVWSTAWCSNFVETI